LLTLCAKFDGTLLATFEITIRKTWLTFCGDGVYCILMKFYTSTNSMLTENQLILWTSAQARADGRG